MEESNIVNMINKLTALNGYNHFAPVRARVQL
jgi:hypothetical protein